MKLRTKLRVTRRLKPNPAHRNFFRRPAVCGYRAHVHDHVQVVAHNRPGMHAAGKNVSQLQNADFNQRFTVLEAFAEVFVQTAKPRPAHTHRFTQCNVLAWVESTSWLRGRVMGAVWAFRRYEQIRLGVIWGRIYLRGRCLRARNARTQQGLRSSRCQ